MTETCAWCGREHDGGTERCLIGVLLVFGGRNFGLRQGEVEFLNETLDRVARRMEILTVRHGAARGADTLAGKWAMSRGIISEPMPANWGELGKRAGPIRNKAMLERDPKPVAAVGFPGGEGTADMAEKCRIAGVPLWMPKPRRE